MRTQVYSFLGIQGLSSFPPSGHMRWTHFLRFARQVTFFALPFLPKQDHDSQMRRTPVVLTAVSGLGFRV